MAVKRVPGTSDIQVGLNSETLSVKLADLSKAGEIESVVKGLGYDITSVSGPSSSVRAGIPAAVEAKKAPTKGEHHPAGPGGVLPVRVILRDPGSIEHNGHGA